MCRRRPCFHSRHAPTASISHTLSAGPSTAGQRGGWDFSCGGPGHAPTESVPCDNRAARCSGVVPIIAGQQGGWNFHCGDPGHAPTESLPGAFDCTQSFRGPKSLTLTVGRRGGRDSLRDPSHAPTESIITAPLLRPCGSQYAFIWVHGTRMTPGLSVYLYSCLYGHLIVNSSIWDGTPRILAGGQMPYLHRQTMLPRLCALTNLWGACSMAYRNCGAPAEPMSQFPGSPLVAQSSASVYLWHPSRRLLQYDRIDFCAPLPALHLQERRLQGQRGGLLRSAIGHAPSESDQVCWWHLLDLGGTPHTSTPTQCHGGGGVYFVIHNLRSWMDSRIAAILERFWLLCVWMASELQCFFRTLALVATLYCTKLWAHAVPLRGGQRNWDPLVRTSRGPCVRHAPWGPELNSQPFRPDFWGRRPQAGVPGASDDSSLAISCGYF